MPVRLTNEKLCIGPDIIADSTNIQSVSVEKAHGINGLTIFMDKDGAARLRRATENRDMGRLALLVDGEILAAPHLRGSISDVFHLVLNMSDDELERMAPSLMSLRTIQ